MFSSKLLQISVIGLILNCGLLTDSFADNDAQIQLKHIADAYETEYFDYFPEEGLIGGKTDIAHDRFMDHSLAAVYKWEQREDDYLASLTQVDEGALVGTPEYLTFKLLKQTLENNKEARICHEHLWNLNPTVGGWLMTTTKVAEKQPVGTPELRAMALKRWSTFPTVVDEEIKNLKQGLVEGYIAPKSGVRIVLKQINIILNSSLESSPYFYYAEQDTDPQFKAQVRTLIQTAINPALQRYADYLQNDYLPLARDSIGLSALPNGTACYAAKIKQRTTLDIPAKEIFDYGIAHMRVLDKEVAEIGLKEFGLEDMAAVFNQAKIRPEYLFKSEQDLMAYNFAAFERAKAKMAAWFGIVPKSDATIQPYPEFRAKTGASGEYNGPSLDGTKPGIYYINTYNASERSRVDHEATIFHELIPGHHLQVAIAVENTVLHSLNRYLWNSGFGEGWALYAERVADEMGLYSDDISRLGMLGNESLRTARLVVDPGIHVMNWTREQAIDYLKQHTALSDFIIEGEVDRYTMMPGQATAYMLGKREIERLRRLAQQQLGNEFDIREFHAQVLKNGSVSLPLLKENIHQWLRGKVKD